MQVRRFSLVAIATLGLSAILSPAALAGQTVYTGSQGRSAVVDTNRQGTQNGPTFQRTTTWPGGQTSTSSGGAIRTGNGGFDRNVTYTEPQGKQTTVNNTGTYQNNGVSGQHTIVYPNGHTYTGAYHHVPY